MGELTFEDRSGVIGSSDATKIMGDAEDWLDLYRMKTDQAYYLKRREEISSSLMVQIGNTLEPLHLMLLGQRLGVPIATMPGQERISHPDLAWMVDRPDGFVTDVHIDGVTRFGRSPVEVKACGGWQQAHERLVAYWPQIQHHLFVSGGDGCVFSMLIGTTQMHYCYAERDDAFIQHYRQRAEQFVNEHLGPRVPPVFTNGLAAARYLVPDGLVPKVYDADQFDEDVRKAWTKLRSRYINWKMAKEDLDLESERLKVDTTEMMRKLIDPKQVKIGTWRCSLTKAGVIQWRDVAKTGEE